MRIVITGGSGNVGTALLTRLGAGGAHDLVGVSRRRPPEEPPYSWAEWLSCDIGEDGATQHLRAAFTGADAVVHLAWLIQPSRDRKTMRRTNVAGTSAVVDAAVEAGVTHFVHQSSVGAYAAGPGRTVDETWPTTGIATSSYSVDKAQAERIVDRAEPHMIVSRLRPVLIFQDVAASEVARYFFGPLVPTALIRRGLLRFAPLSEALAFQVVHADDVAAAIELVLLERAGGAFNVAAAPVIGRAEFRDVFGGVGPAVPPRVLRTIAAGTWRARLQPTEPGWIDLAAGVPTMDSARLMKLGWKPTRDARDVLSRFVDAMSRGAGRPGPLLHRARRREARKHSHTPD